MKEENLLEGMPPIKKLRKKVVKKFHSSQNVPVEVAIRRQVAAEIGEDEPTKDQKFILLQKYGATAPRIDRLATKPNWMGVPTWKRLQNDWFKMTKGLVKPQQMSRGRYGSTSKVSNMHGSRVHTNASRQGAVLRPLQSTVGQIKPSENRSYRGQPSSHRPLRNNPRGEATASPRTGQPMCGVQEGNHKVGDRP